jgi:hypothetical protein
MKRLAASLSAKDAVWAAFSAHVQVSAMAHRDAIGAPRSHASEVI